MYATRKKIEGKERVMKGLEREYLGRSEWKKGREKVI